MKATLTPFGYDFNDLQVHSLTLPTQDRASMVAIEPEHRPLYVAAMKRLVKPNFRYLIVAVEYDTSKVSGPPHSLSKAQLEQHYAGWSIDFLGNVESSMFKEQPDQPSLGEKFIKAGTKLEQLVYMLRNK